MSVKGYKSIQKLTVSALFMALCMVLPFATGQIPEIGNMLCPMHIPVMLCGYLCGWQYGLTVGFASPLLRSFIFAAPPLFPQAVSMAFELAAYGFMTGFLYKRLPEKNLFIYINLFISMLAGRFVWGAVRFLIFGLGYTDFSFELFLAGAFVEAVPGIILQIILVPLIVIAIKRVDSRILSR